MNCICIERVEQELADHMRPRAGDDVKATCNATALCFGKSVRTALMIPFTVKGSKKGYSSAKGCAMSVAASFCPFCGVSTTPPKDTP